MFVLLFWTVSTACSQQQCWIPLDRPTNAHLLKVRFVDSLKGWTAGENGTILHTKDGGTTWTSQASGTSRPITDLFLLNERHLWALALHEPHDTNFTFGTIILNTTNGGQTWNAEPFWDWFFYSIYFLDSLNGWMGGEFGRIMGTTNGGQDWFDATIDSLEMWGVNAIKFYSPGFGIATGGTFEVTGMVWRTTNGGELWHALRAGAEPLMAIHFHDSLNIIAVGGDYDYGAGMVASSDAGVTWQYTPLPIWGQARSLSFRTPSEGWSALGFAGTYMITRDSGRTWADFNTPDTLEIDDIVFTDDRNGYMVGRNGRIYKYDPSAVSVQERTSGIPERSTLFQNYPNPFNPTTTICYELAEKSEIRLSVYDVLGRELRVLVDGVQPAGPHRVVFDARGVSSGIYLYRLATTSVAGSKPPQILVGKMLLIR
jgi:photosystem II stability/assembly factor-like uncharacterized protein